MLFLTLTSQIRFGAEGSLSVYCAGRRSICDGDPLSNLAKMTLILMTICRKAMNNNNNSCVITACNLFGKGEHQQLHSNKVLQIHHFQNLKKTLKKCSRMLFHHAWLLLHSNSKLKHVNAPCRSFLGYSTKFWIIYFCWKVLEI